MDAEALVSPSPVPPPPYPCQPPFSNPHRSLFTAPPRWRNASLLPLLCLTTLAAGALRAQSGASTLAPAAPSWERINYYRAMAGLPADVTLDPALTPGCQEAAMMMAAKGVLSRFPDTSWPFYSVAGVSPQFFKKRAVSSSMG